MEILKIKKLKFPEVKLIRFARFRDQRGYFTETYQKRDFAQAGIDLPDKLKFVQVNESFSKKGTIRGLHFQWNPYMGKLVRTISGQMVDLVLDIRKNSPHFGQIIAQEMFSDFGKDEDQWIWLPPGFGHGNFFLTDTAIEYYCTGGYNPQGEVGISPLAKDIDWSLCDKELQEKFKEIISGNFFISEKDSQGLTVSQWQKDPRANNFIY